MLYRKLLTGLYIACNCCSLTTYGQQEITALPLDRMNHDSLDKMIGQREKEANYKELGILYGGVYNYYLYSSDRDSAIKYAMKAEENTLKAGDSARYYFIKLQTGDLYKDSLGYENAIAGYKKAHRYYTSVNNYTLQSTSLGAISYIYELKKDTANQLKYLELAEEALKISKDTFNMVGAGEKRAKIMMGRNQLDAAIELLKRNVVLITHATRFGNGENIRAFWYGWQLNKLGDCYYRKKQYSTAIHYLRQALPLDQQTSDFDAQNNFRYRLLVSCYIQNNQKDSAIRYAEAFFKQSLKTLENISPGKLKEINARYENEKKQREIDRLQQQTHLQELAVSNQRKLNIALACIIFLTLASALLVIKNARQKRKIAVELAQKELLFKEQLHLQKESALRDRISRDLHDDVGATLSSVKAFSEILKDNPDNPVVAELIKENATEMIERLEVIAWATNPQHDNFKSLESRIIKFAAPLCHAQRIEYSIDSSGIDPEMQVPGEVRQNIFLIVKEAVNNMIKYAEATTCSIHIGIGKDGFVMQVTDNGKGADGLVRGNGSGWKNMQKRAEYLGGQMFIQSEPGSGTTIRLHLAYPFEIPNIGDNRQVQMNVPSES